MRTEKIKIFLVEALAGFIFWTVALTPYMLFIVKVTFKQYLGWIGMQLILVPPLASFSVRFIVWLRNKLLKGDE